MRPYAWLLPIATALAVAAFARPCRADPSEGAAAGEQAVTPAKAEGHGFEERFLVDPGRFEPPAPDDNKLSFSLHGEYQLRVAAFNDLPLEPPLGAAPGVGEDLGSNFYLHHWLRVRPRFQYRKKLAVVGEIDIPFGMFAGQTTQYVSAARDDYETRRGYDVQPRKLYLEYLTPVGLFRVGHQTSQWGMGILANDGDQATVFGNPRRGSLVERLLFATRPLGADHPFAVAIAGDFVFEDRTADVIDDGDRTLQAVLALRWEEKHGQIGLYGVYRHQERDQQSAGQHTDFTDTLDVGVADLAGNFRVEAPARHTYLVGDLEAAFIGGKTTFVRNVELTAAGETEKIISFGGAARLGVVHAQSDDAGERWGDVAVSFETGYTSGDADPYDGTTRRFTMDQNHNVGLVLFDHVLAWKTARSATIAADPAITARPAPGLEFLPSEGGIFGASYINPTVVVRPRPWVDLKAGAVIAQATADFVDPFEVGARGNYANYEGGDETKHDLGVELDAGADFRIDVAHTIIILAGAEGGVLFPGAAFEDAAGGRMRNQYLLNGKLGLSY